MTNLILSLFASTLMMSAILIGGCNTPAEKVENVDDSSTGAESSRKCSVRIDNFQRPMLVEAPQLMVVMMAALLQGGVLAAYVLAVKTRKRFGQKKASVS